MIFGLIAIGCFVAILFIHAHDKDKAARRKYNVQVMADAVQAGKEQQALEDDVNELNDMIAQARARLLKGEKR